ncbi:YjgF-like protein, partial [Melanomma pulvis-pyrius CBS 109.77]
YSHISRIPISPNSTLVSFAGQIGRDSSNLNIPTTLAEQCTIAFANVDKCLEAVGAKKEDIIQVRQYIVNLLRDGQGQDPERAKRYAEWMGGLRPPSTVLGISALAHKDLLYEIEIICVV